MTDNTQPEALDLADWLEAVGGGPSAKRCAALLREQHARITELEAKLAQRFDAADVATASAQGFRDGVASLTAQAADSVPAVEREQERIAFKDAHRHLDLDEVPDAWWRPMFKHSHVEASWLGWIARASHGQAPAPTHEQIAAYLESTGAYVTNDATREAAIAEAIDTDRAKRGQAPDLHPKTSDLVQRFAAALAEKLSAAEKKYGYSDGWASPNWMDECRQHLSAHIAKGDPRDVAAYCAFLWHHGATTASPQAAQQASAGATLRSMIEGMSVSVDVSTGDHDAGHRYFGTVTEVMECQGDKHGVTLLVQDAEPNFTATPTAPSTPSSTAQQASTVTNYTTLGAAMRAIRQSIQMIGDPEDECMRAVKRVLRGAVIIVEDSGDEVAAPAAPAQPAAEASRFGSPELQAMIIARCVEKDQADSVPAPVHELDDAACRCEPSDYVRPADYDGDGSVAAMARRAARAPADQQLFKFYGVTTDADLIAAQARHIERLQAKLPQTPSFAPQRVREG